MSLYLINLILRPEKELWQRDENITVRLILNNLDAFERERERGKASKPLISFIS